MKNILVTTSIPYCNAEPHIGFAMELIEADTIARWYRQKGHDVFLLTGTDEHGTKMWRTAKEKGVDTQEFVDLKAAKFKELCKLLNASNNDFIRTTEERHKKGSRKLWNKLFENNFLEKRKFKGLYCWGCEAYLTEKDLVDGKCPNHQREPEILEEENWFFKLSEVSEKIVDILKNNELKVIPDYRKNEILEFARKGLRDVSFSRPKTILPWGVSTPNDEEQVMYVWCDALTNYITGIGYGSDNEDLFDKYWTNGRKIQVIGKDILRFHAAYWPAMLMVAGEKTPDNLLVHGFLTSEGQKMSKTLGNVVDPFEVVDKHGADALRFYLLHEVPFGNDADFSQKRFEEIKNAYLADGLGNLLSRVHTLSARANIKTDKNITLNAEFENEYKKAVDKQNTAMENFELHRAIQAPFEFVAWLNRRINELEPWKLLKTDETKAIEILKNFLESLRLINEIITPFLPETAGKIKNGLGLDEESNWSGEFGESQILFPKDRD